MGEERRKEITAEKSQLKAAKKVAKQKKNDVKADCDDDLDALLEEFSSNDYTCSYGPCNVKIHTLMDMISKCKYCNLRFCLTHAQAEAHGCGDCAQRAEQKQFRQAAASSQNSAGSGLAKKSCGDN